MTDNAVVLLDALLADREELRGGPPLPADEAFELFSFEQCLKEQDLSPEEMSQGQVGGGNDGGIDGVFTFLNGNLVEEDAEVLDEGFDPASMKREPDLVLVVIQAKQTASFAETPFEKLSVTLGQVLALANTDEQLAELFSAHLVERLEIFRRAWHRLSTRHPRIRVEVWYATKGNIDEVNEKVSTRATLLVEQVQNAIPKATAEVRLLGARELVDLAGRDKSYTLQLAYRENATDADSHVALVSLADYYSFITDSGTLRKYIFDWNVRDYEGAAEVNREIAESLAEPTAPEFWWLNNGVTVICSNASATGKTFSLDDVQIVNGLQTSVTIYEHLHDAGDDDPARNRSILVRIIVTDVHATRDRVIRATNRQTAVPPASFRATDQIQRDLEQYFLKEDWFYERRKNYYRNQGRTPARIISIPYLAQAIMAVGLSEPSNSRARPSSLLKRDADYQRIFDPSLDYAIYLWVARVQKSVDGFLRSEAAGASASERTNLRFHLSMLVVADRFGGRVYNPSQLKDLVDEEFSEENMLAALANVREALQEFQEEKGGQIDKIAKARDFTEVLITRQFPPDP